MTKFAKRGGQQGGILAFLLVVVFLVVLFGFLYAIRRPLLRFVANTWIIDDPPGHADAIVVLSGDNFYGDRAAHAAQLFRQGVAPIVVASGRRLRPNAAESELIEHDLIERGVPKDRIVRSTQDADSTREEAIVVERLAEQRGWKSLVVATSNFHTRRTRYIYRKVFPRKILVTVSSARDGDFDPERWWEQRRSVKIFVRELAGMVVAIWELRDSRQPQETRSAASGSQPESPTGGVYIQGTRMQENPYLAPLHALTTVIC